MAPYPEEIDVFTLPHSRMKQLVDVYSEKLVCTDFADYVALESLLHDLHHTFCEFKSHEQIENKFIMKKLKKRLKTLSIHDAAVCNCHSDNKLSDMLALVEDGYSCTSKPEADRINFGVKLQNALQEFTGVFLPHMKEEEEVFQPMLIKYFEYEELKCLKEQVIQEHSKWHSYDVDNEKISLEEAASDLKLDIDENLEESAIDLLPSEILSHIFSFLSPRDLLRCSVVSRRWYDVSYSPTLWREIYPCFWAHGIWQDYDENHEDRLKKFYPESLSKNKQFYDEDADIDEYEESEEFLSEVGSTDNFDRRGYYSETTVLVSMITYLLPRVGSGIRKVHLSSCRGLTTGLLRSILILCPNVVHLDVSYTSILDAAFKGLKDHLACTRIQYLDLSGCQEISDLGLYRLADSMAGLAPSFPDARHDLQEVYLEDCRQQQQQNLFCGNNGGNDLGDCCCEIEDIFQLCHRCEADQFCSSVCFWQKNGIMCRLAKLSLQCPYVCGGTSSADDGGSCARRFDISSGGSSALRTSGGLVSRSPSSSMIGDDRHFAHSENRTLKFLNLSGCKEITDEGLRCFLEAGLLGQLEFLDVSGCSLLTGQALCSIVEEAATLMPENLFYCDQIDSGPYPASANGCQNLENGYRACCCNRFL